MIRLKDNLNKYCAKIGEMYGCLRFIEKADSVENLKDSDSYSIHQDEVWGAKIDLKPSSELQKYIDLALVENEKEYIKNPHSNRMMAGWKIAREYENPESWERNYKIGNIIHSQDNAY